MDSIKLQIDFIVNTVNKIVSKSANINNSTVYKIMFLITLVCNSTSSQYKGDDRPRVKVNKNDIEQSFLYNTGAQRSCMPFKAVK